MEKLSTFPVAPMPCKRIFDLMRGTTLCLTGTIVPATSDVSRSDVGLRLADYKAAIEFYLQTTDVPVVFAENSNYDLTADADFDRFCDHPRFRLLRVPPHPDVSKGKGFQEFHMLDRVVESGLLGTRFAKVTGRYLVHNAAALIDRSEAPLHIDLHRRMKVALTGFFIADTEIHRRFFHGLYADADDRQLRYIEHVLYDRIANEPELTKCTSLLPLNPEYEGVSGSYGDSLRRHPFKMKLRSIERMVNRSLGIHRFLIEY